jgi:adenylate kinase family enzyme
MKEASIRKSLYFGIVECMKLDDLYKYIRDEMPQILYVSGKTCVGKSTFASKLKDNLGYEIIELDKVVFESVIKPQGLTDEKAVFVEVYKNSERRDLIDSFVAGAKRLIAAKAALRQPIVIDGAVANVDTLAEVFDSSSAFVFVYFHPKDLSAYQRNLASRFMLSNKDFGSGLPKRFWEFIDDKDFEAFCKDRILSPSLAHSIKQYARSSRKESEKRLSIFKEKFSEMIVIEI